MLCACSGEQFKNEYEEPTNRSSESLSTREFSVLSRRTGESKSVSSRTAGDLGSKYEDVHVDEVESTLKEALSLNYEEARALLGRIEYQKGNVDAALQLFQGIDIKGLTPRMISAIAERSQQRKLRSKNDTSLAGVMSWHSVSLLLEAILLKAKVLEQLGNITEAAKECEIILDTVETALPNGMPTRINQDNRMQEIFHKALELLPELWKKSGSLDQAIMAYRRAIVKPWNLDFQRLARVQKDLALVLLYGGVEVGLPPHMQIWRTSTPRNNLEESLLLLSILVRKAVGNEIEFDPEVMDHLSFGLSMCGGFEYLALHMEQVLPGIYNRVERWYFLALCYSAAEHNETALGLVRKIAGPSESRNEPHFPSLLLGAKLCAENKKLAHEGIGYCRKIIEVASDGNKHFLTQAQKFLGICYSNAARSSTSNLEREIYQKESLKSLNNAASIEKGDPFLMFNLGLENFVQRNLDASFGYTKLYSNMVAGSSMRGWKLLALIASAQKQFEDAEDLVDIALDETTGMDQLELVRLKSILQIAQDNPKQAIENCATVLAQIQAAKKHKTFNFGREVMQMTRLATEAWQDLSNLYTRLKSWRDAEICVEKAKSIDLYNPQTWHSEGMLSRARSQHKKALTSFSVSLSIDPDHVHSLVSTAEVLMEHGNACRPIAKSLLMNALQIEPTNHEAWLNLGLILKNEGLLTQAADCFQASFELNSTAPVQSIIL